MPTAEFAYTYISPGDILTASTTAANGLMNPSIGGVAGRMTYLSGIQVTGGGATAASLILVQTVNLLTNLQYYIAVPAGATLGIQPFILSFFPAIPASALGQSVQITVGAFGAGNTNAASSLTGFYL